MRLADLPAAAGNVLASAIAGLVGGAAWVRLHRHPDLANQADLERHIIQHELDTERLLVELRYIRERLDRLSEGR